MLFDKIWDYDLSFDQTLPDLLNKCKFVRIIKLYMRRFAYMCLPLSFKYEHHKEESARVVKLKRRAAHIYHKDIKTYLFLNKICLKD